MNDLTDPLPKTPTSPKVILAAIFGFVAPALFLTIGYLTTDDGQQIYSSLHPVLRVLIGGLITSASVYLAGYLKRDRLRERGVLYRPEPLNTVIDDGESYPRRAMRDEPPV